MASILASRRLLRTQWRCPPRSLTTSTQTTTTTTSFLPPTTNTTTVTSLISDIQLPNTHYKITLRRSAISLGDKIKGTLISLGIHRRMQTVYHRHSPEVAGKILRVKELVEVHNVPEALVKTKQQQTQDRKATRGYKVLGNRREVLMGVGTWTS